MLGSTFFVFLLLFPMGINKYQLAYSVRLKGVAEKRPTLAFFFWSLMFFTFLQPFWVLFGGPRKKFTDLV